MTPLALAAIIALSPASLSQESSGKFHELSTLAIEQNWLELPLGEVIGRVGRALCGTPYVAFTLEVRPESEACVVNLSGLDCVTLFENSLAFGRMLKYGTDLSIESMLDQVQKTRYRGGKVNDYPSRLHYTSDWIFDNVRKGTIKDLSASLPGAKPIQFQVGYMSANPEKYKVLKMRPNLVPIIRSQEEAIKKRTYHYVPTASIAAAEPKLKTGDIVGLVTNTGGIDISHTGLCYRDAGVLKFLHANSRAKKVMLDERLSAYLAKDKKAIGIVVVRPL